MRVLALSFLLAAPAAASTEDVAFGARAAALADAVTADSEGLGSLTVNPAAVGQLRRIQVEATHRRLFQGQGGPTDLDGMGLAAAFPIDTSVLRGAFGLAWTHDIADPVATDRSMALTYGSRSWRELGPGTLDAGLTFKTIGRSGRAKSPTLHRLSALFTASLTRLKWPRAGQCASISQTASAPEHSVREIGPSRAEITCSIEIVSALRAKQ